MKLNETEWQYSLIKSYKSSSKLLCISDCSTNVNCKLITHNKMDNTCKYYRYYLDNETKLIQSNGEYVYNYKLTSSTYNLKAVQHKSISAGCQIISLITLPDGNLACGCLDGNIKIWSRINWTSIRTFLYGSCVYSLAILQNKYLVSGGDDKTVKIWDYKTGSLQKTIAGHTSGIRVVLVLNNHDIVSGSYDNTIRIWDSTQGILKYTLSESYWIFGLVQLKNGNLVTFCWTGNIKIWNPFTGILIKAITTSDTHSTAIQLNNQDILIGNNNGNLRIFDPATYQFEFTLQGHTDHVIYVMQLKNNDFVSCSWDFKVKIWNWNNKSIKYDLTAHTNRAWGLAELPNGYLATAAQDSKIIIWK
jgi:WD40 repeat protein